MQLFKVSGTKIENVQLQPFKLERELQKLIERNTEELFQLEFICSELAVGRYRIDSLCYDPETNGLVIIEYKKGKSSSVIDQGYTYLQLLLNNKSDFVLAYSQHRNTIFRQEDIDWSQSRIIFVAPSFSSYQRDSINFKDIPFDLYEIRRFENDCLTLDKLEVTSKESIDSLSSTSKNTIISDVSKEVRVFDEETHSSKLDDELKNKWELLKAELLEMDEVELEAKKMYVSAKVGNKTIAYFNFRRSNIAIDVQRGINNIDGTPSKNFFTLDDPKNLSTERSWEWKSGARGNIYVIQFDVETDLDYVMFLLKQKYRQLYRDT